MNPTIASAFRSLMFLPVCLLVILVRIATGQTDSSSFSTVIDVPPESSPLSIGTDTQLNLDEGGEIPRGFLAGAADESSQNVEVNIYGGLVSDFFGANSGSVVNVLGGQVGGDFDANNGSRVNLYGGTVGRLFDAKEGSVVNIEGGVTGQNFTAESGSEVNVSGGRMWNFYGLPGSNVNFFGGEFVLNGAPLDDGAIVTLQLSDVLTGVLEDGTTVIFSSFSHPAVSDLLSNATLHVRSIPDATTEPVIISSGVETSGLRAGQSMIVNAGGSLGDYFASVNATLNIAGGAVGNRLEAVGGVVNISDGSVGSHFQVYSGTQVNVSGGHVGLIRAYSNSEVNISGGNVGRSSFVDGSSSLNIIGGSIGDDFRADSGSTVNVRGGEVGRGFDARSETTVNIFDGTIGSDFKARFRSGVNISGGSIGSDFSNSGRVTISGGEVQSMNNSGTVTVSGGSFGRLTNRSGGVVEISAGTHGGSLIAESGSVTEITGGSFGSHFNAHQGSDVSISGGSFGDAFRATDGSLTIYGDDFRLNGSFVSGGATVDVNRPGGPLRPRMGVLNGVLEDGSVFIFSFDAGDVLSDVRLVRRSVPPVDLTPATLSEGISTAGLRPGQELTLKGAGKLGRNFAVVDATLNIEGGSADDGLEVLGGAVNIYDGVVGLGVNALPESEVNIFGGVVGGGFDARQGSTVNILGGSVGDNLTAYRWSEVNISGGSVGTNIDARFQSAIHISGGNLGWLRAVSGGFVGLYGDDFRLNGVPVGEVTSVAITSSEDVFTGVLEDGTSIALSRLLGDFIPRLSLFSRPVPPANTSPITVSEGIVTKGLRPSQTLILQDGAALGDYFTSIDATLVIEGGTVGERAEIIGGIVRIEGGSVGDFFNALGSKITISGGIIGSGFEIRDATNSSTGGGVATILDGELAGSLHSGVGSTVNILGGTIKGDIIANEDSEINIYGGRIGDSFIANFGSQVNLFGTQFSLNGVPLESKHVGEPYILSGRDVLLEGILSDGSAISFDISSLPFPSDGSYFSTHSTLTINFVPEPSSSYLIMIVFLCAALRERSWTSRPFEVRRKRRMRIRPDWS